MGKLLSFAIPCYNSAEYMEHCINTVLAGGDEVEVIIVDDGSTKDNTYEIAKRYEKEYPDIVKAVHQENGGHGEAVNTGLKNATGRFFKVLDSDDWFDEASLVKVIQTLKKLGNDVDMMICNYVYDKPSKNTQKPIRYTNALPENKIFRWYDVKYFYPSQNLLMHSIIYRTEVLRASGLVLPKHTFLSLIHI